MCCYRRFRGVFAPIGDLHSGSILCLRFQEGPNRGREHSLRFSPIFMTSPTSVLMSISSSCSCTTLETMFCRMLASSTTMGMEYPRSARVEPCLAAAARRSKETLPAASIMPAKAGLPSPYLARCSPDGMGLVVVKVEQVPVQVLDRELSQSPRLFLERIYDVRSQRL